MPEHKIVQSDVDARIALVKRAKTDDFVHLVRISGLDPAVDFQYANLTGVDFSGMDLSGFNFTGARMRGCSFQNARIRDTIFVGAELDADALRFARDHEHAGTKSASTEIQLAPISVALADDHPLFLQGVEQTFRQVQTVDFVATGTSRDDAVRIVKELAPDILLLDIQMPGGGIEAAQAIAGLNMKTKIIMLTASESEDHVAAALEAGACGYVLKGCSGPDILKTIHLVHKGGTYISPSLAYRMVNTNNVPSIPIKGRKTTFVLTPREEDILDCIALGKTNKEIATHLNASENTVKHYMTTIMYKLQVRNRVEVALKARLRQKT